MNVPSGHADGAGAVASSSACGGLARLVSLMAPPAAGGDVIDWSALERQGACFPGDYKEFVAAYGGGDIDDILSIDTPPVPDSIAFMEGLKPWETDLAESATDPSVKVRVLPFGHSLDGDVVFWECRSEDPDDWKILVFKRQHGPYESAWRRFDYGMVDLLAAVIEGSVRDVFSTANLPGSPPVFRNWRDSPYLAY